MSGPEYRTVHWDVNHSGTDAITRIEKLLADGWQLHGSPIALSGDRVLQALVKRGDLVPRVVQGIVAQGKEAGK